MHQQYEGKMLEIEKLKSDKQNGGKLKKRITQKGTRKLKNNKKSSKNKSKTLNKKHKNFSLKQYSRYNYRK